MLRVSLFLGALICACANELENGITIMVDTVGKIAADGYYSESHHVTTEDGYILQVNRIPYGRFQNESTTAYSTGRPVVFLMHGIMTSAMSYIILGHQSSIAYNLADAGFDVWMGNARGVLNSRNHIKLNPNSSKDKKQFFDFTFDEIGRIDVPTMIDYVLKVTGQEQLHYIGHSQGGTVFLTLASSRPDYNKKFKSVHLLAPVGYQEHFPSYILKVLARRTDEIYNFARLVGLVELSRPGLGKATKLEELDCSSESNMDACDLEYAIETLANTKQVYDSLANAALKQIAHYGQNIRDKSFRRWNYGSLLNLIKYGRSSPPKYDLSLITTDVTLHYTVADVLADERDTLAMANAMPNARARRVSSDTFSHTDFVGVPEAKPLVTDYIIEQINKYYK